MNAQVHVEKLRVRNARGHVKCLGEDRCLGVRRKRQSNQSTSDQPSRLFDAARYVSNRRRIYKVDVCDGECALEAVDAIVAHVALATLSAPNIAVEAH